MNFFAFLKDSNKGSKASSPNEKYLRSPAVTPWITKCFVTKIHILLIRLL